MPVQDFDIDAHTRFAIAQQLSAAAYVDDGLALYAWRKICLPIRARYRRHRRSEPTSTPFSPAILTNAKSFYRLVDAHYTPRTFIVCSG